VTPLLDSVPFLAISAPPATGLGTGSTESSISGPFGTVTVSTASGSVGQVIHWTATTSASAFTTGGGTANETVAATSVSYASGFATVTSGLLAAECTPGQPLISASVALSSPTTAFSCNAVARASATSVSWNPTVSVTPGAGAVSGTYTGTITHSVA
jgi:hypothetical protein